jgi:hypothetical protein
VPKKTPPKQGQFEIKYASRAEVEEAVEEMPDEYLECRTEGHSYVPYTAAIAEDGRSYHKARRCQRCNRKKGKTISLTTGEVLERSVWDVPSDYGIKGKGLIAGKARDAIQLAQVLREVTHVGVPSVESHANRKAKVKFRDG